MHKTQFCFLTFFLPLSNLILKVIIVIKPAPGDHESKIKKVGSTPCEFNTTILVEFTVNGGQLGILMLFAPHEKSLCSKPKAL